MPKAPEMPDDVASAFAGFATAERAVLQEVRAVIFARAAALGVGRLTECLKWGQPAYLTEETKAGSTLRLGLDGGRAAVFFNCNTSLVEGFRSDFPEAFSYEGKRALLLDEGFDRDALDICLTRGLTYHRERKRRKALA